MKNLKKKIISLIILCALALCAVSVSVGADGGKAAESSAYSEGISESSANSEGISESSANSEGISERSANSEGISESSAYSEGISESSAYSEGASGRSGSLTHTVVRGDTMWKIAVRYKVGISEMKAANTHIKDPNLIYPGQVLYIPTLSSSVLAFENEVVRLVNEIRAKNGLGALTVDWELSRVARYKSQDMHDSGYFAHNSPTYGTPFQMMRSFGISYRSAAENIARGYATPAAVVDGWMNSSGHRANILNPSFTHIGVGYVSDGHYWTQMFILR